MGATAPSVGVAVRTLMILLFCLMVAALVYVIAIGALASFFDFGATWAIALLTDFTINVIVIGAWFFYKESSWIKTLIFIVLMFAVGSLATCGYILIQFHKLSPEEFSKDPLYFVLVRHQNRDVDQQTRGPSVISAKVIFSGLGCLMLGILIYTVFIDLSPSQDKAFAPCLPTYLTDIYIHAVVLSVCVFFMIWFIGGYAFSPYIESLIVALQLWIAYKESSWKSAFLWILPLSCLGNITTCVYIVRELFYLSPQQPVSLIIFNNSNRQVDMLSSDLLLY